MKNKDESISPNITPISPPKGSLQGSLSSISLLNLNSKHGSTSKRVHVRSTSQSTHSDDPLNLTNHSPPSSSHDH